MLDWKTKTGGRSLRTIPQLELHLLYKKALGDNLSFGQRFNSVPFPISVNLEMSSFMSDTQDLLMYLDSHPEDLGAHACNIEAFIQELQRLGVWPPEPTQPRAAQLKAVLEMLGLSATCQIDELMNRAYHWYQLRKEPDLTKFAPKQREGFLFFKNHLNQYLDVTTIYAELWPHKLLSNGIPIGNDALKTMRGELNKLLIESRYQMLSDNGKKYGLFEL